MTIPELRRTLRSLYGLRNYRITKDRVVYVYGVMPNTNLKRWYVLGRLNDQNLIYQEK